MPPFAQIVFEPRGALRIGRGGRKSAGDETQPEGLGAQFRLQSCINHACGCSRSLPATTHARMLTETGSMTRPPAGDQRPLAIEAHGLVKRFDGKGMAVVGYETDSVRRTAAGVVSVPINMAYNHRKLRCRPGGTEIAVASPSCVDGGDALI